MAPFSTAADYWSRSRFYFLQKIGYIEKQEWNCGVLNDGLQESAELLERKSCRIGQNGCASVVEPFSDEYNAHAAAKKIPLAALQKLNPPMNLLKIQPISADFLNSDFKRDGYDSRQHFEF